MTTTFAIRLLRSTVNSSNVSGNFLPLRPIAALPVLGTASATSKHWDPKWKKLRAKKVLKVNLPDYEQQRNDAKLTIEEMRTKLKERGVVPPRYWNEKPMLVSCSGDVFDPYVPPEGDGKISLVSSPGLKQKYDLFGKKGKSYLALRKIRNNDYEFDVPTLAENAQEIYIETQKAMSENDEEKLHELLTEKAYPEMMDHMKNKTVRWKFMKSLEPPRGVHVRCEELFNKGNIFGQVTIRFHTQQTLAIYDRFGRLVHGSEDTIKDVLEYIVFEKLITSEHGTWRVHAKLIPEWAAPQDFSPKTHIPQKEYDVLPEPEQPKSPTDNLKPESETNVPALA